MNNVWPWVMSLKLIMEVDLIINFQCRPLRQRKKTFRVCRPCKFKELEKYPTVNAWLWNSCFIPNPCIHWINFWWRITNLYSYWIIYFFEKISKTCPGLPIDYIYINISEPLCQISFIPYFQPEQFILKIQKFFLFKLLSMNLLWRNQKFSKIVFL